MAINTSGHILSTSANLLGFCLFVITSLHIANLTEANIVDEFTSVVGVLLTFSCLFSFISIRTSNEQRERRFETIADYLFISSLIGVLAIISLLVFHFIR